MIILALYKSVHLRKKKKGILKVWNFEEVWIKILVFWLNSSYRKYKAANHPTA